MRRSPFFILLIAGILFAVCGVGYGLTSHEVMYQQVSKGTIAHYLSASGIGYLQMTRSSTLYIVHETTFSPAINGIHTFADGDTVSLVYDPASTKLIDVSSKLGTHLYGNAYNVVEITSYNIHTYVYATADYTKNIHGYYKNNWLFGGILILVGLFLVGLSFFVGRKSKPAIEPKQASMSSFQDNTSVTQPQSLQPDIAEQNTAPHPQVHLPTPPLAAQITIPHTPSPSPSQPIPFANQTGSLNRPSFSGLPSIPKQSSTSNPPSFSGLLSAYKQQTLGNQPTVASQPASAQPASAQPASASQQQFLNVPQLSFDQPLPSQQAFPLQPTAEQAPASQESPSQPFAQQPHYPQNDDDETTQIADPPSQSPQ